MDKKKLKVVLEMLDNKSIKYPETAQYIENNMMEVSASEKLSIEDVFFLLLLFIDDECFCFWYYSVMFACLSQQNSFFKKVL